MIKSEKWCSASRCCLGILLVLGLTTPLLAGEAAVEQPTRRSYNFQDIDIRQVLSALAQDQEINLILAPEVTGKITVHLHQLTLEEAIRGITMAGGFAFTKQDDSYYVYKPKDIRDPQSDAGIIRAPVVGSADGSTKLVYNFQDLDIRQALSALARSRTST